MDLQEPHQTRINMPREGDIEISRRDGKQLMVDSDEYITSPPQQQQLRRRSTGNASTSKDDDPSGSTLKPKSRLSMDSPPEEEEETHFDHRDDDLPEDYYNQLRILTCVLVGALLWILETLLAKVLISSYHAKIFFDRVQGSLFNHYAIHTLFGPPFEHDGLIRHENETLVLKSNIWDKTGITVDRLLHWTRKNISAWNLKRLTDAVMRGQLEGVVDIKSENQAKGAAKEIVNNVSKHGSNRVYLADLMRFLREDEALKVIRLFDGESEKNGISKGVFENWVVHVFRDRKALTLSLKDTNTAVNELERILNIFVGILIFPICLLILEAVRPHYVIVLCTELLLTAFVFGNTCKTVFEAIIFMFVLHPYDVGDRCEIDGVQLVVERMHILTTEFIKLDNQKTTYHNSVLATKPIANYRRSAYMEELIDLYIDVSTTRETVVQMKELIASCIENNSDHWLPKPKIVVRGFEELNRLKISIRPTHRMNFQDIEERWERTGELVEEIRQICKEQGHVKAPVDSKS